MAGALPRVGGHPVEPACDPWGPRAWRQALSTGNQSPCAAPMRPACSKGLLPPAVRAHMCTHTNMHVLTHMRTQVPSSCFPTCTLKGGLLLAQQPQTGSSLATPEPLWWAEPPAPFCGPRVGAPPLRGAPRGLPGASLGPGVFLHHS